MRILHSMTGTKKEPASTISMDLPSPSSSVSLLYGKPNAQPAFLMILAEEILSTQHLHAPLLERVAANLASLKRGPAWTSPLLSS